MHLPAAASFSISMGSALQNAIWALLVLRFNVQNVQGSSFRLYLVSLAPTITVYTKRYIRKIYQKMKKGNLKSLLLALNKKASLCTKESRGKRRKKNSGEIGEFPFGELNNKYIYNCALVLVWFR